jgi:phage gpG-like protein
MLNIEITTSKNIDTFEKEISNTLQLKPDTLKKIATTIRKGIEYNIEHGLTYMGSPVAPLSLYTILMKGNSRPLVDTGQLLRSIKDEIIDKNSAHVFVGSNRELIAKELNDGKGKMPARPFFGLSKTVLDEIDKLLGTSIGGK